MDFDSPDVEKDFPGLYASESGTSRKKDEDDCKYISDMNLEINSEIYCVCSIKINNCVQLFTIDVIIAVSDGDHEKLSKKEILLGRRKDKKDKKDRGYATLDGESSPEEELDAK